jgi:hypothetical protein
VNSKLTWKVKRYDINTNTIIDYDVLKDREDFIKKLKKKCANKEEFSEALRREFMYRFWFKAEYELIISINVDKVILQPWCGCREPEKTSIFVSDESFDWFTFANYHLSRLPYHSKAKIDVYSQLAWQWNKLVDYCWYTHLRYERKHEKFERK